MSKTSQADFGEFLALASAQLQPICEALRAQIVDLHEQYVEIVWLKQRIASFGVGPKKMTEHYAYIAIQQAHINLGFYHGASLADPEKRLEGTGKKLRHVKLRNVEATRSEGIRSLLCEAIEDRKRHC